MKKISMKKISAVFLCFLLLAPAGFPAELFDWLKQPYVEHPFAPVDLSNSPRIRQLLRSGNIYLSLSDAIALAIENNLDIQLERYTLPAADTGAAARQRRRPAARTAPITCLKCRWEWAARPARW